MIFLYPLYVLLSMCATLVACIAVNWWAPLFATDDGNLPRWLRWFQTFDASLDAGWKDGYLAASWGSTRFHRYLARVYWMYRNPAYGFDYWPLGGAFVDDKWRVLFYRERDDLILFFAFDVRTGRFNFHYHGRFGVVKLGWKAWNYWTGYGWKFGNFGPARRVPLCFTVTPANRLNPATA